MAESDAPSDGADYENPDDSVCTTFQLEEDLVDADGENLFTWSFKCTRCGRYTACEGDPRGFGGRPYACLNCSWVSLLEQDAIEEFADEHYVETGGDRSEEADRDV